MGAIDGQKRPDMSRAPPAHPTPAWRRSSSRRPTRRRAATIRPVDELQAGLSAVSRRCKAGPQHPEPGRGGLTSGEPHQRIAAPRREAHSFVAGRAEWGGAEKDGNGPPWGEEAWPRDDSKRGVRALERVSRSPTALDLAVFPWTRGSGRRPMCAQESRETSRTARSLLIRDIPVERPGGPSVWPRYRR